MSMSSCVASAALALILSISFTAHSFEMYKSNDIGKSKAGRFAIVLSKHKTDVSAYSAVSKLADMGTPATSLPTRDKRYKRIVFALALGDQKSMIELSRTIGGEVVKLSKRAADNIAVRITVSAISKMFNKNINKSEVVDHIPQLLTAVKKIAVKSPSTHRSKKETGKIDGLFLVKSATDGLFKMDRSKPHKVTPRRRESGAVVNLPLRSDFNHWRLAQ